MLPLDRLLEMPFSMTKMICDEAVGTYALLADEIVVTQLYVVHLTGAFSFHILGLKPP